MDKNHRKYGSADNADLTDLHRLEQEQKMVKELLPGYKVCSTPSLLDACEQADISGSLLSRVSYSSISLDVESIQPTNKPDDEEAKDEAYLMPDFIGIKFSQKVHILLKDTKKTTTVTLNLDSLDTDEIVLKVREWPIGDMNLSIGGFEIFPKRAVDLPHYILVSAEVRKFSLEEAMLFGVDPQHAERERAAWRQKERRELRKREGGHRNEKEDMVTSASKNKRSRHVQTIVHIAPNTTELTETLIKELSCKAEYNNRINQVGQTSKGKTSDIEFSHASSMEDVSELEMNDVTNIQTTNSMPDTETILQHSKEQEVSASNKTVEDVSDLSENNPLLLQMGPLTSQIDRLVTEMKIIDLETKRLTAPHEELLPTTSAPISESTFQNVVSESSPKASRPLPEMYLGNGGSHGAFTPEAATTLPFQSTSPTAPASYPQSELSPKASRPSPEMYLGNGGSHGAFTPEAATTLPFQSTSPTAPASYPQSELSPKASRPSPEMYLGNGGSHGAFTPEAATTLPFQSTSPTAPASYPQSELSPKASRPSPEMYLGNGGSHGAFTPVAATTLPFQSTSPTAPASYPQSELSPKASRPSPEMYLGNGGSHGAFTPVAATTLPFQSTSPTAPASYPQRVWLYCDCEEGVCAGNLRPPEKLCRSKLRDPGSSLREIQEELARPFAHRFPPSTTGHNHNPTTQPDEDILATDKTRIQHQNTDPHS